MDAFEWLCASITSSDDTFVATYFVNPEIEIDAPELYTRLCNHFAIYKLAVAYSTQATTEIAENLLLWKEKYLEWGEAEFNGELQTSLQANVQNAINLSPKNARKNLKKLVNSCLVIEESENRSEENTYQLLPAFKVYFEDVE